ncbi:uncharacterized protein LOC120414699 [Culex pipiens pallens]|uniref:uncharacterized protein LOC120414699 n=1 Tax=Culex pipiens pallens TaxID=42434 RepID=UPI001954CD60|nr:uncharacterized protein LOC120414699 [Culex pipiens pallens]
MALIGGGFTPNKLFDNPELSDVAIVLDNDEGGATSTETKTFHGHRVILATMSDYFRSMLYGSFVEATKKEIRLPGVPYSAFVKVMQFVYYGWTRMEGGTLDEAVEHYTLVRMLLLDSKMNSSFEQMMLRQINTVEAWKKDLVTIFALAFEWDMPSLKKACISKISETANEFLENSSFLKLPLGAVQMMLDTSPIYCTRAELRQTIQAWIDHHNGEIAAGTADELIQKVSKLKKFCYNFKHFSLYPKKDQDKPEEPEQPLAECSKPMEALQAYSYKSKMKILKCFTLKGIKICLKANPQLGPQHGRIKSELELCLNISSTISPVFSEYKYSNSKQRNLTVRYDLTQQEQQSVTIFVPEIKCCKDAQVIFSFSWQGSGVQPLLHKYGPARSNKKLKADSSYVTHIIYRNEDEYDSDGRCQSCPGLYESDQYSSSSFFESSDEEMEPDRSSENASNED